MKLLDPFMSLKELINFEQIIAQRDKQSMEHTKEVRYLKDTKTGDIEMRKYKIEAETNSSHIVKKLERKKTKKIIQEYQLSNFNFICYCTKTIIQTEELVSMFMSECLEIQYLYILIKPNANQYTEVLIEYFKNNLGFNILQTYSVNLHEQPIDKARMFLQELCTSEDEFDLLENNEPDWISELKVLQVSKTAGRLELMTILQDCSFAIENISSIRMPLDNQDLDLLLFPIWNSRAEVNLQQFIEPEITKIYAENFLRLKRGKQQEVLDKFLNLTTNDELEMDENENYEQKGYHQIGSFKIQEHTFEQKECKFLHVLVQSKNLGQYEIRILKNPKHRIEFHTDQKEKTKCSVRKYLQREFKFEKLLYEEIRRYYLQKTPSFYQFKMLPESGDFDPPNIVFDCTEYMGSNFIHAISDDIKEYLRVTERHEQIIQAINKKNHTERDQKERENIISFAWGIRLASFVKKMEKVAHPEIEGFGKIIIKNREIEGIWNEDDIMEHEIEQYNDIFYWISELEFLDPQHQKYLKKAQNLLKLIEKSETYRESRIMKNRRVFPSFVQVENLRLFQKMANLDKETTVKGFEQQSYYQEAKANIILRKRALGKDLKVQKALYENNEISREVYEHFQYVYEEALEKINEESTKYGFVENEENKEEEDNEDDDVWINKDFCFVYVEPIFHTKYRLVANILYLLKYDLGSIYSTHQGHFKDSEEYKKMQQDLQKGFLVQYKLDQEDEDFLQEELQYFTKNKINTKVMHFVFMEMFFIMLDVLERYRKEYSLLLKRIDDDYLGRSQYSQYRGGSQVQQKVKLERKIEFLLQKLVDSEDFNIFYDKDSKLLQKEEFYRIQRKRFFKPEQKQRHNIPQSIKEKLKYKLIPEFDKQTLKEQFSHIGFMAHPDDQMKRWLNRPDTKESLRREHLYKKREGLLIDKQEMPSEINYRKILAKKIEDKVSFKNIHN